MVAVIMLMSSTLQGAVGYGMNLLAAPILLVFDKDFVPGPALAAGLAMALLMTIREREGIHLGELRWAIAGRLPGTVVGALLVAQLSHVALSVALAGAVMFAVLLSALGISVRPRPTTLVAAGVVSGVMGTATSIGGPPIAMLYQHETGPRVRGMLSSTFLVGTMISIVGLGAVGEFGRHELILTLGLLPGIVAGFTLSRRFTVHLDDGHTRVAILVVAAVSAVSVVVGELL